MNRELLHFLRGDISKDMIASLIMERDALREALRIYGRHSEKCANDPRQKCTCGFNQALTVIDKKEVKP